MPAQNVVAEKLKAAHEAVAADLQKLETAFGSAEVPFAQTVHARLADARGHLAKQFRFEEKDGYMRAVRERNPNREHTIEELRLEHRRLEQMLENMVAEAARVKTAEEALRAQVRTWVAELRHHEAAENTLVQEVFNLEIGAED